MRELSAMELKEVEGGVVWIPILSIGISCFMLTAYIVDNWDKAVDGWNDGVIASRN